VFFFVLVVRVFFFKKILTESLKKRPVSIEVSSIKEA
jgi:hypothetical protein